MGNTVRQARGAVATLVALLLLPGMTLALDDFEEDESRNCMECPQPTDSLVDPVALDRPDFSAVFNLYTSWDSEDPQGSEWGTSDLQAFVDFVMRDYVNEATPWESIAHRTAFYFGHDVEADYDQIKFPRPGTDPLEYYDEFNITLRFMDSEDLVSCAAVNCVALGFDDWAISESQVAHDNFAHEFGHLAHWSLWWYGLGCESYGDGAAFREFISMSSEYYNGYFDCTLEDDPIYQASLIGGDWENAYNGQGNENRRYIIRPFTLYLQEHFRGGAPHGEGDLLYAWIHGEACEDTILQGPHDWRALADLCGHDDFDDFFSNSDPDSNLRELFQEYALSLWVNDDGLAGIGQDAVWDTGNGREPQEYRFFSGDDGGFGCNTEPLYWPWDAARVHPLYNVVDTTKRFKRDRISYLDIYPEETPHENYLCALSRPVAFETYGMFIVPFVADDDLDEDAEGYNLHVEVVLQDSLYTGCGANFADPEFAVTNWPSIDNDLLHFWILGYPADEALKDTLDLAGASTVLLGQRSYPPDSLYVDKAIELVVPGFARTYSAVAVVATLTEELATAGVDTARTIPFLYKYWADKDFTMSGLTDFVYADTLRVHGEITVPDGLALSLDEGTVLAFAEHDLNPETRSKVGFRVYGELTLAGQSGQPIALVPMDAGEEWTGFTVCSGGELTIDYADITGEYELLCLTGATAVDIQHSSFTLADDAVGFDLSDASTASMSACEIQEATTLRLAAQSLEDVEIHQASGTTATAVYVEGDATLEDVLIYSASTAIKCASGDATLTDVSASSASTQSCLNDPTYGLVIESGASAEAGTCTFDGFCTGARLNGSGVLYMRQSEILDAVDNGVYLPGKTARVDLGYPLTGPPPLPEGMYGDNCIATEDLGDYRVYNRSTYTALALGNYWGTETPTSAIFNGSVAWADSFLTSCPGGSGGPGMSLVASPATTPRALAFGQPVPNPFNPSCELKFTLPGSGAASTLAIYDLSGRHLATLFSGRADGREHNLRWDGRDDRGHPVSSGVYFAQLSVGSES